MKIIRILGALTATAALLLTATACSDDSGSGSVSDVTKKAGEMASSATAKAADAASKASEKATEAQASASAKVAEIKGGVEGKGDVELGDVTKDGGRGAVELTVDNSTDETASYTVTVNFQDADGNVLDVSVVDVKDVEPGKSATATARSNRDLDGDDVQAEVGKALRR